MRSVVFSSRIRQLLKMSSLGVLAFATAGCSSGFQRFDGSVYTRGAPSQTASNPYPGDVDKTTTASTGSRLVPLAPVAPQPEKPAAPYYQGVPTYGQPATTTPGQPQQAAAPYRQGTPGYTQPQPSYRPNQPQANTPVRSQPLSPTTISASPLPSAANYSPPRQGNQAVYIPPAQPDNTTTASTARNPAEPCRCSADVPNLVTVRQGDTLRVLSARYQVPVSEILRENRFNNSYVLRAGEQIIIPGNQQLATNVVTPVTTNVVYASRCQRGCTGHHFLQRLPGLQ